MNQQIGNSHVIQENEDRFSEFRLVSDSTSAHSPLSSMKPKRKRGRPRKALPSNILTDAHRQDSPVIPHGKRSRKKILTKKRIFHDDIDPNFYDDNLQFPDEELTTLDEFEKISRTSASNHELHEFKRIDKPTVLLEPATFSNRKKRRQIDPSTCERDYSQAEIEFMNALNEYKRSSGRLFPTCSEILEVLITLGYEKKE